MILALLLAQVTPTLPMPRGTGLPPAADTASDTQAVLATVQRFLAALDASDGAAILATTHSEGGATATMARPDGTPVVRHMNWADFAKRFVPGPDRFSEAISDPAVEIDGGIAMVWAPYVVRRNGAVLHCGYDHFDLVRDAGQWKLLNITWSQRTTGCPAA